MKIFKRLFSDLGHFFIGAFSSPPFKVFAWNEQKRGDLHLSDRVIRMDAVVFRAEYEVTTGHRNNGCPFYFQRRFETCPGKKHL